MNCFRHTARGLTALCAALVITANVDAAELVLLCKGVDEKGEPITAVYKMDPVAGRWAEWSDPARLHGGTGRQWNEQECNFGSSRGPATVKSWDECKFTPDLMSHQHGSSDRNESFKLTTVVDRVSGKWTVKRDIRKGSTFEFVTFADGECAPAKDPAGLAAPKARF